MHWTRLPLEEALKYWKKRSDYSLFSPDFYKVLESYYSIEYWCSDLGVMPLVWNEFLYNSIPDIVSHVEVDMPVTNLREAIISFPKSIGLMGCSWKRRDEFNAEEVEEYPAVMFKLPDTFSGYIDSLSCKDRKDYKTVYRKCDQEFYTRKGITHENFDIAIKWFLDKWEAIPVDEVDPVYINWYRHHVNLIKTLFITCIGDFVSLYKKSQIEGERDLFVGVNVGEKVGDVYYDYFSSRDPVYDREYFLGKLITYEVIKRCIAFHVKQYELGPDVWEYKNIFIPKGTAKKKSVNILSLHNPSHNFKDIYPPYYLNNTLIF